MWPLRKSTEGSCAHLDQNLHSVFSSGQKSKQNVGMYKEWVGSWPVQKNFRSRVYLSKNAVSVNPKIFMNSAWLVLTGNNVFRASFRKHLPWDVVDPDLNPYLGARIWTQIPLELKFPTEHPNHQAIKSLLYLHQCKDLNPHLSPPRRSV